MIQMSEKAEKKDLWFDRYEDASNLNTRIRLYERFSTKKRGWYQWAFEQLDIPPRSCILELGCGTGLFWLRNSDRIPEEWDITLSDLSPGMLREAKRELSDGSHRFKLGVIDAQAIPFRDETFDAVLANHMLYHVPDRKKTFSEILRVLKAGGCLYASTNSRDNMREVWEWVSKFDLQIPLDVSPPKPFTIEDGVDEISQFFSEVKLRRYEDVLLITEAGPLVAAIRSLPTIQLALVGDELAEFTGLVERELRAHGAIRVTASCGIFAAWKKEGGGREEIVSPEPSFIARFDSQRNRIWPEVEAFFQNLPSSLKTLGWSFVQRGSRESSPTGQFKDAFKSPKIARAVYLPLWHTDAYLRRGISFPDEATLQTGLFVSSFLTACAIRIYDDLIDEDKPDIPKEELLLAHLLYAENTRHLQGLFPSDSPLWDYYTRFWAEYSQAIGVEMQRNRTGLAPFDEEALRHVGNKMAPFKTYPLAVALHAGQAHEIERIEAMMDALHTASQLRNDLDGLKSDVESRHYTPPIAQAALSVGYETGTHPPIEGLYGALFLSDAVVEIHALALQYFERAHQASVELGIDDLTDYLEWHMAELRKSAARWRDIRADRSIPCPEVKDGSQGMPVFEVPDSLNMAFDFLQFDPEFREAWEIQRTGVLGQKLLIGDLFSRSLVLEVLAEQGRVEPGLVEEILSQFQQNGWRYYRDFKAMPPDIDDVAQAVHLLPWTSWDQATRREYLKTPLRWLEANRTSDGGFPVWLTEGIDDRPGADWDYLGITRCIACEANLLMALEKSDIMEVREWISEGIKNLLDRWEVQGYNAVHFYKPAYTTFILARCFEWLQKKPWIAPDVSRRLRHHRQHMAADAVDSSRSGVAWENPLTAAATVLALLHASEPPQDIISQGVLLLEQQQSFDGGWEVVDFFSCPGPSGQGIGWHRSRLLTTAVVTRTLAQGRVFLGK